MRFPEELVRLIFVQEYTLPIGQYRRIEAQAGEICGLRRSDREKEICEAIERDQQSYADAG